MVFFLFQFLLKVNHLESTFSRNVQEEKSLWVLQGIIYKIVYFQFSFFYFLVDSDVLISNILVTLLKKCFITVSKFQHFRIRTLHIMRYNSVLAAFENECTDQTSQKL